MDRDRNVHLMVVDFNPGNLKSAVIDRRYFLTSQEKSHLNYFQDYLQELGCKKIVVEDPYVDGDYLDDYSAYYVKCFKKYKRKCKRVHFFSEEFNEADLKNYLINADKNRLNKDMLQQSYLGFTVIRPLPEAIIGRTALKTYPPDSGRRHFPCTREYRVGFLGTELNIRSLAFQEQDTVLAACATTALWSALHKTSELFGSKLLTPSQITASASRHFLFGNRAFPSHGLNMFQLCQAIKEVGLEPEFRDYNKVVDFSGFINGYLRYGIPVILGLELQDPHCSSPQGLHAVTIVGYSLGGNAKMVKSAPIPLAAHAVDKYYVHDDQVGPFSRLTLDNPVKPQKLTTGWPCDCGCGDMLHAIPKTIFVPVYHKIRITYEDVVGIVAYFHEFYEAVFNCDLIWDIFLSKVNQLKSEIYSTNNIEASQKYNVLMHNYPRYIWRAVLSMEDNPILELIFDSTDIQRGMFLNDIIYYYDEVKRMVKDSVDNNIDKNYLPDTYKVFLRKIITQ